MTETELIERRLADLDRTLADLERMMELLRIFFSRTNKQGEAK